MSEHHLTTDPVLVAAWKRFVRAGWRPFAVVIGGEVEMVWYPPDDWTG